MRRRRSYCTTSVRPLEREVVQPDRTSVSLAVRGVRRTELDLNRYHLEQGHDRCSRWSRTWPASTSNRRAIESSEPNGSSDADSSKLTAEDSEHGAASSLGRLYSPGRTSNTAPGTQHYTATLAYRTERMRTCAVTRPKL